MQHLSRWLRLQEAVAPLPSFPPLPLQGGRDPGSLHQMQMLPRKNNYVLTIPNFFPPLPPQGVVILGHSTGCQDAVRYCQRHRASADAAPLLGAVLQAPVSDVEWFATNPPTAERLALARAMVEQGKGEEIAFRIKVGRTGAGN
mgnify:CR=1 FL=1